MTLTHIQQRYILMSLVALCAFAYMLIPEIADAATYNVTAITGEIKKGETPVGSVASASIGLLAVRRTWKIIRGSI